MAKNCKIITGENEKFVREILERESVYSFNSNYNLLYFSATILMTGSS